MGRGAGRIASPIKLALKAGGAVRASKAEGRSGIIGGISWLGCNAGYRQSSKGVVAGNDRAGIVGCIVSSGFKGFGLVGSCDRGFGGRVVLGVCVVWDCSVSGVVNIGAARAADKKAGHIKGRVINMVS